MQWHAGIRLYWFMRPIFLLFSKVVGKLTSIYSFKLAMVGVFTAWKLANATDQSWLLNIYQLRIVI